MLRIAVLISGSGTTLKNLIQRCAQGSLRVEIGLVISSHPRAGGLRYAAEAGIPAITLDRRESPSTAEFSRMLFDHCTEADVDLVVMGGFLVHVLVPTEYEGRVMNIHPSLIPAFCGKGYYGRRVHEAVLAHGVKLTGCTVHFVDDHYDHGPIILQRAVVVEGGDTLETLAARVFSQECDAYPTAIQLFADRRLRIVGRHVEIL